MGCPEVQQGLSALEQYLKQIRGKSKRTSTSEFNQDYSSRHQTLIDFLNEFHRLPDDNPRLKKVLSNKIKMNDGSIIDNLSDEAFSALVDDVYQQIMQNSVSFQRDRFISKIKRRKEKLGRKARLTEKRIDREKKALREKVRRYLANDQEEKLGLPISWSLI